MLWVCFETPSIRDFRMVEIRIQGTKLYQKEKSDYLKLIKNREWTLLWVYNKVQKDYMIFQNDTLDKDTINKIDKLISIAKKHNVKIWY